MQIAVVQLDIVWEDKTRNHHRVGELLAASDIQPGTLIVLPEMFDTGFSMQLARTAQSSSRESEAVMRQLARQFQSTVLGGVVGPVVQGKASNEAVAFSPAGDELVRYQKQRPFSLVHEGDNYPAGTGEQMFDWNGVCVAPFVCYDLRFPELFRPAVFNGAELIAVIACWPAVRSEHWVRLLQARAIENLAITVGCNRCGEEPGLKFDGRSCAFDHMGAPLFEADSRPQVLKANIDIEALRRWRQKFPALRDGALHYPWLDRKPHQPT
jgi:predicted amidohydrolase